MAELFIVADILLLLQMCEPFNRQLYVIEIDILKGDRVYFFSRLIAGIEGLECEKGGRLSAVTVGSASQKLVVMLQCLAHKILRLAYGNILRDKLSNPVAP